MATQHTYVSGGGGDDHSDDTAANAAGQAQIDTSGTDDLLDEIRRRSGEPERPRAERDYLGRLLDRF